MRPLQALILLGVVGATTALAAPIDLKGKTLQQTFNELLPDLGSRTEAQQRWQDICFQAGAPGNEKLRLEACQLMAARLGADTANPARMWLLKQLERVGRDECVDAVATLLNDKDDLLRDAAVRCLANNPAAAVTAKLLGQLPMVKARARVGVINALGQRADPAAVEALTKELADTDAAVKVAAARALGKIGTPEAARALAAALESAQGEVRLALGDAYLLHADRLLKAGKITEASAVYKALNRSAEARPTRLAALQGMLRTSGDGAGNLILEVLGGTDEDAKAVAVGQIENLSAAALQPLAANLEKLPPASQVLVLIAIAARGDRSQVSVALAAAKSTSEPLRRAGIQALGRLGDVAVVPLLLETTFAGGNLAGPASDSLVQLAGEGVNEKIIAALEAEKTPSRVTTLIAILERRKAASAVPALLKAAQGPDAAVRTSALTALKTLAELKHVPEMVSVLLKTEKGKDRDQAELAIMAVCAQVPEAERRADPVLAVLEGDAKAHKSTLLPLLGRLGGPRSLAVIKESLRGGSELEAAAVIALCNWPDPSVSEELLKLAQGAKEPGQRLQALRAVIRVNTLPNDFSSPGRLPVLQKAMDLAPSLEERKLILEGIGVVRQIDTLRWVLPYLDDKDLVQSACKGVVELAHSRMLREPNKPEFDKALDRVIVLCKDKALVDRAKQYKQAP